MFHAKTATIKGRNGKDLTETEVIRKKWQEYTEERKKKKVLMNWVTTWCDHSPEARHPGV